jgi:bacteriocin-like protein
MSKTNDTSKLACTTQDRELRDDELASRALAENELAHVSGGVFTVTAHMRRVFAKLWWRKIMSKTSETSKLNHATPDDHGTLVDSELGAVAGGTKAKGSGSWSEALAQAWGNALDANAASLWFATIGICGRVGDQQQEMFMRLNTERRELATELTDSELATVSGGLSGQAFDS